MSTPKKHPFDHLAGAHRPFSWISDEIEFSAHNRFAELTMNVAAGTKTALDLIHTSELDRQMNHDLDPGDEEPPFLSAAESLSLLRLVMVTNELLHSEAERHIEWVNKYGKRKPGRAKT